ncbi:MAG: hypothetical protein HOL85_18185 [Rhodospirillaceae bacterium]|nr:hypothetical protein [Rhodospirillaceae bacterium]
MIHRMRGLVGGFVLTVLLALSSVPVAAQAPTYSGEAGDGFDLLVFDWPSPVRYSAERFGNLVAIRFNTRVTAKLTKTPAGVGKYVSSARVGDDGRSIVLELTGNHRLKTSRRGNSVVIQISDRTRTIAAPTAAAAPAPAPAATPSTAAPTKTVLKPASGAAPQVKLPQAPVLKVRTGQHADYDRLVFDWPSVVPYRVEETANSATVMFESRARIDEAAVRRRLPAALKGFSARTNDTGVAVTIPLPEGTAIKHFPAGSKVVVDVLRGAAAKRARAEAKPAVAPKVAQTAIPAPTATSAPAAPQANIPPPSKTAPTAAPAQAVAGSSHGNTAPASGASAAPASAANPTAGHAPPKQAAAHAGTPAGAQPVAKAKPAIDPGANKLAKQIGLVEDKAKDATAENGHGAAAPRSQAMPFPQAASSAPPSAEPETHGDAGSEDHATGDQPADADTDGPPAESLVASLRALEDATISGPPLAIAVSQNNGALSIRFNWTEQVAAAAFTRAGYLWIGFDQPATFDLTALRNQRQQTLADPEQIPVNPGSALRVRLVPGVTPRVWRDGASWVVDLQPQTSRPDVPLRVDAQMVSPQGPRVFVPAEGVGRVMVARDPEVGDRLFIIPLTLLSRGIDGARRYAEFRILSSVQGLAVQPLTDGLEMRVLPDGVAVTGLGGLQISRAAARAGDVTEGARVDGIPAGLAPGRIFDVNAWRRGGINVFLAQKQNLQRLISESTSISRSGPRLRLAQFYFAHGLSAETMGLLRTIETSDEELGRRPDVKALKGASDFMLGRFKEAEESLSDRNLNGFAEAELWRGVSTAAQGRWREAVEHFARAGEIPGDYPRNFTTELALLAAEAAIKAGDFRGAGAFIDVIAEGNPTVGEQARLNYLRGRVLYASGDVNSALEFWRRLSGGSDRWSAVRSKRALIEHDLRERNITQLEAIEDLEGLRYAWRGDQLEFDLLRDLGRLYLKERDYASGLAALRQAVSVFPDNIFAKKTTREMIKKFSSIYTDGTSDEMTPLSALSLYDQFRELTPVGKRGDAIIQRLADRLVQVDLLDRAAILLNRQVKFRLQGQAKARVGSRLALISLLDRNPEKALSALNESVAPGLGPKLALERKRLRARAIFEIGDAQTSLKLLKGDSTRDADLLRADIFWRTQEWAKAAPVFQRLIGNAGEDGRRIPQTTATLILNWAVALSLSEDNQTLNNVRQKYAQEMDNTAYREAFRLITNKTEGDLTDFRRLTERFKEIGRFQAFLSSYRDRLKELPLSKTN